MVQISWEVKDVRSQKKPLKNGETYRGTKTCGMCCQDNDKSIPSSHLSLPLVALIFSSTPFPLCHSACAFSSLHLSFTLLLCPHFCSFVPPYPPAPFLILNHEPPHPPLASSYSYAPSTHYSARTQSISLCFWLPLHPLLPFLLPGVLRS